MNYLVPDYLPPFVLGGTVATLTAVLVELRSAVRLAGERVLAFWSGTGLLLAWAVTAVLFSWFGIYQGAPSRIPTIQYGILLPIVAVVALFQVWPALRRVVAAVPQEWILSVQVFRAMGVIFLVLYAAGHLPGVFAWPAGTGDMAVGLLAPAAAIAYRRNPRSAAGWVRAWNLLGLADLVVAVTTGFLSSPSPLQRVAFDSPNELISVYPLALIPLFLVPLSVLLHLASLQKLGKPLPLVAAQFRT